MDEASLATFPEEFQQGMAARWQVLGDTGKDHPDNWIGGLAGPKLHAIAILFARDAADREQSVREHNAFLARTPGVELLSSLDLEAIPPFDHVREHFGYRDRLTTPEIEGMGIVPTPGSGPPIKAGEFILGYPDEEGPAANLPQPEILSRNGSYMAYRRFQQHIGAFRDFLRERGRADHGRTRAACSKTDGPLAKRHSAGARTRERRSVARRRPAAQQQFQLRENGSPGIRRAARIAYSQDESA
jgi:hypothetical protein